MDAARIGVRELQQNASRYLDLVQRGATLEVTRHGRAIARITPIVDPDDPYAEYFAAGLLIPADDKGDLADIVAVPPMAGAPSMQEIFDDQRGDRL